MGRTTDLICSIFIALVLMLKKLEATTQDDECHVKSCSHDGPPVRFPFWLKGRQPHTCGYPGFELSCTDQGDVQLQLPYSGKFFIKKIEYMSQRIQISDPDGCIFRRLLHLNLSSSPFSPFGDFHDSIISTTLLNCSSTNTQITPDTADLIDCLSDFVSGGYRVFSAYDFLLSNLDLSSCSIRETVPHFTKGGRDAFNWQLDYILSWNSPRCGHCEADGSLCRLKNSSSTARGNDTECLRVPLPSNSGRERAIRLVAAGLPVCIVLVIAMIIVRRRYRARYFDKLERANQAKIEKFLEDYKSLKPTRYSYADIKRITNHFQKKLGEGGYGSVFKGIISNEIPVAVKILNDAKGNGEEFINEVGTIGMIHHVNVVRLLGFCADGFKRALVYEFLPNESLEKFIFLRDSKTPFLGWTKLRDIAVGIAKGIEYLHQGCDQRILHFDIKPHNILLDYNFNPKISDFGLAKLCSKENSVVSMTAARGTMGYIAPEVVSRNFGNVSYKSDVYSFGMMLLEMVGGRKNADAGAEKSSQVYFPEWIYNRINQEGDLEIKVETEGDEKIARKLTIVGLWCIQWYPIDRPSMKTVVQMLEGETESLVIPPSPFTSTATEKKTTGNINDKPAHQVLSVISEQDEVE